MVLGVTLTVTCHGRTVDDTGRPYGDPCGTVLRRNHGGLSPWTRDDALAQIRAAGWVLDPDQDGPELAGMCPRCRRPTREATQLARETDRRTTP